MRAFRTAIVYLLLVAASTDLARAKQWRSIVPLHSTRQEVERLLGVPTHSTEHFFYYDLVDVAAVIWFQAVNCSSDPFGLTWNVPLGTVISIGVIPKTPYKPVESLDREKFKIGDGGAGYIYYADRKEGLSIETHEARITSLTYLPTEEENHIRCPRVQECCVDPRTILDAYGDLKFREEKARLDNYALQMKKDLHVRGVLIGYDGVRSRQSEAKRRAERARNYLVKKRGIKPWRVVTAYGGFRRELTVELQLHPIGSEMFVGGIRAHPTVDPRKIRVIGGGDGKRRPRREKPQPAPNKRLQRTRNHGAF